MPSRWETECRSRVMWKQNKMGRLTWPTAALALTSAKSLAVHRAEQCSVRETLGSTLFLDDSKSLRVSISGVGHRHGVERARGVK